MSFRSFLRALFSSPLEVGNTQDNPADVDEDLDEEMPAAAEDAAQTAEAEDVQDGRIAAVLHPPSTIAFEGEQAEAD